MNRSKQVLCGLVIGLMMEIILWAWLRYRPSTAGMLALGAVAPWCLLLPGLWRGQRRPALWAVLLTSPYLGYGLMEMLANPGARMLASVQVFLSFAVFAAAIAYLRMTRPQG
jgi:uncharacterized membrane protein